MPDNTPQGVVRNGDLTMTPPTFENTLNIRRLNDLAFRGLTDMLDKDSGLFCYRLKRDGAGLAREGVSPRYTVMTLLGLHRLEMAGVPSPVGLQETFEILLKDRRSRTDAVALRVDPARSSRPDRRTVQRETSAP
jgi:hypothetical protein